MTSLTREKLIFLGSIRPVIDSAISRVEAITAEPEVGRIYKGTVAKLMEFGAFVNYMGDKSGLVHISQLAAERVAKTEDVVKVGDIIYIKLTGFDDRGKAKLSMKVVDQQTGEDINPVA